jgi:DNA-binding transcriptional LysR family regulator
VKPALQNLLEQSVVGNERLQIVVGRSHPWFQRHQIAIADLFNTSWVMREPGSGTQQVFEQALQSWGVDGSLLQVVLVLNSSEMVKAVLEGGVGAAALPELMVQKELRLGLLNAVPVVDVQSGKAMRMDIMQPIWKLKHQQRFQTQIMMAFEQILENGVAIAS